MRSSAPLTGRRRRPFSSARRHANKAWHRSCVGHALACLSHAPLSNVAQILESCSAETRLGALRDRDEVSRPDVGKSADATGESARRHVIAPEPCEICGLTCSAARAACLPRARPLARRLCRYTKKNPRTEPRTPVRREAPGASLRALRPLCAPTPERRVIRYPRTPTFPHVFLCVSVPPW